MGYVRRLLPRFVWLAFVAALALALVPAVTHAMGGGVVHHGPWSEICSTAGKAAAPATPEAGTASLDHCTLCAAHQGAAPPPAAPFAVSWLPLGHAVPALFLQAPATLHAWVSAQPRAPPASC